MVNDSESGTSAPGRGPRVFIKRYRTALIVVAVLLILLVVILQIVQHRPPAAANGPGGGRGGQNGPVAVSVATVTPGDIQIRIPALGTVTTLANVTVRTQISGTLQKISFIEGQLVHAGDVIAQIDPRPYEAALQTMQGNLRRDQALLADARLDLKRYEGLVKEDSIAAQQLDTQRALVDQYMGTIESDEGQVNTARVNLLYTRIVSPVTGRVGIRQVDQGNYVTPGDTNGIVVINQLQPISVIFSIPEDNVTPLMKKVRAGSTMKVEAYDRANAVKLAEGKLSTVDNEIDTTTGTVKLRAQFDNPDGSLFPNQFVNVSLLQDLLQNQLIMPNAAVRRGAPNGVVTTFVYLVKPDQTVSVRPVTLGAVDGERVAVVAGLAAGDVVVTEGGDRLRDGAPVQLPASAAGPPGVGSPAAGLPGTPPGTRPPGAHRRSRPNAPQ
ncbi:MAG: efflux transporter, family, subunit [Gammaproteobacteria bacterium]|nr:efflux transporter, family, subunit [Gammaproteobacteria bacterium]